MDKATDQRRSGNARRAGSDIARSHHRRRADGRLDDKACNVGAFSILAQSAFRSVPPISSRRVNEEIDRAIGMSVGLTKDGRDERLERVAKRDEARGGIQQDSTPLDTYRRSRPLGDEDAAGAPGDHAPPTSRGRRSSALAPRRPSAPMSIEGQPRIRPASREREQRGTPSAVRASQLTSEVSGEARERVRPSSLSPVRRVQAMQPE